MNVLIGCEKSGIVRDAFIEQGHNAWSCDLQANEHPNHIQKDVFYAIGHAMNYCGDRVRNWDLIIAHPPCTALAVCGNRTYAHGKPKYHEREKAIKWTVNLWRWAIRNSKGVCFENPNSVIFPYLRNGGANVQYIQPYQFGHPETKKTGLALYRLPELKETDNCYDYMMTLPPKERHRIWYMSPSNDRSDKRSETYPRIALAMAEQWQI